MARRQLLSVLSAVVAVLPMVLSPAPAVADEHGNVLLPVAHLKVVSMKAAPSAAATHQRRVELPARPADPGALKAAKARVSRGIAPTPLHGGSVKTRISAAAGAPCASVTQTASPTSPQAPGASVQFAATATGCPSPTYEFWLLPPGGAWSVVQGYGSSNTWTWNTTGLAAGTYTEDVYARDASSSASYDTYLAPDPTYTLQVPACSAVTQTVNPASPQAPGASVQFSATATGCPNPTYEFWIQPPGGAWSVVQGYSTASTWTWNTTGLATGTYTEDVYARDATSTATYDTYLAPDPTYTLQGQTVTPCASVSETASPASPQAPGTTVKFTATATACTNPTYEFWLAPPSGGWSIVQPYSSTNTWNWNTTGLAAGDYLLDVYARDAGSSASFDAHISPNPVYTLQAAAVTPCASVSETASPASPQAPGVSVKFTATATGCPNPTYEFWLQAPGGTWSIVQAYSATNTWTWNTTGLAAGTYLLDVYARDTSSTASFDAHISPNPTYSLQAANVCTSVSETATPPSPAAPGTSVKFTATAAGCPSPTYEFWLQAPGGTWSIVQAYSAANTWTWNTSGLSGGTYLLDVYVRQSGSSAVYEAHISPNPSYRIAPGWNGTDAPGVSAADEAFCCVPPDTTGSIGPSNYVEIINTTIAVYDRKLNLIGSTDLASFSNAGSLNVSDPQIQWDPRSGRWLYSLIGFTSNFSTTDLLFGWSKTSDPTNLATGWCRFGVVGGSLLPDYPKLGHDDNFIIVGANLYDMSKATPPFVSAQIYAMPKPAAGDTSCTAPTAYVFADSTHPLHNADGTMAFTPVPANTADASKGAFIVAAHSPTLAPIGPQTRIMTWNLVKQTSGKPALNPDGDLTVGSFDVPANVPQPGGGPVIDSLDGRLTQAVAHADPGAGGAEAVWTQQTINGPGGRSVVRWYELLPATHVVRQQGQVTNATDFVFNGAISPSISGNDAVVVYDRGGTAEEPLAAGQGRSATAPLGTLDSGETVLVTSTGADTDFSCYAPYGPPCRWGDYGGASPDPSNPGVVWGTEEWYSGSAFGFPGWGTQNFALKT